MKAIAVKPGTPNSVHMADLPKPSLTEVADGTGVLVRVLKVGVDATDREINDALYGNAPEGYDFLTIGHEVFGVVGGKAAVSSHFPKFQTFQTFQTTW